MFTPIIASTLALLATVAASPVERQSYTPVTFTGYFPTTLTCGTGTNLGVGNLVGFEGGSGDYSFFVIQRSPGANSTHVSPLLYSSTRSQR